MAFVEDFILIEKFVFNVGFIIGSDDFVLFSWSDPLVFKSFGFYYMKKYSCFATDNILILKMYTTFEYLLSCMCLGNHMSLYFFLKYTKYSDAIFYYYSNTSGRFLSNYHWSYDAYETSWHPWIEQSRLNWKLKFKHIVMTSYRNIYKLTLIEFCKDNWTLTMANHVWPFGCWWFSDKYYIVETININQKLMHYNLGIIVYEYLLLKLFSFSFLKNYDFLIFFSLHTKSFIGYVLLFGLCIVFYKILFFKRFYIKPVVDYIVAIIKKTRPYIFITEGPVINRQYNILKFLHKRNLLDIARRETKNRFKAIDLVFQKFLFSYYMHISGFMFLLFCRCIIIIFLGIIGFFIRVFYIFFIKFCDFYWILQLYFFLRLHFYFFLVLLNKELIDNNGYFNIWYILIKSFNRAISFFFIEINFAFVRMLSFFYYKMPYYFMRENYEIMPMSINNWVLKFFVNLGINKEYIKIVYIKINNIFYFVMRYIIIYLFLLFVKIFELVIFFFKNSYSLKFYELYYDIKFFILRILLSKKFLMLKIFIYILLFYYVSVSIILFICIFLVIYIYMFKFIKYSLINLNLGSQYFLYFIGLAFYYFLIFIKSSIVLFVRLFFVCLFRFKFFWFLVLLLFICFDFNFVGYVLINFLFVIPIYYIFCWLGMSSDFIISSTSWLFDIYLLTYELVSYGSINLRVLLLKYIYCCQVNLDYLNLFFPCTDINQPDCPREFNFKPFWNGKLRYKIKWIKMFFFWYPKNLLIEFFYFYWVKLWITPWVCLITKTLYFVWWPIYCIFIICFFKIDYNHIIYINLSYVWLYCVPYYFMYYFTNLYYFFNGLVFLFKYKYLLCLFVNLKYFFINILKYLIYIIFSVYFIIDDNYYFLFFFYKQLVKNIITFYFFTLWGYINLIYIDLLLYFDNVMDLKTIKPVFSLRLCKLRIYEFIQIQGYSFIDSFHSYFRISPFRINKFYSKQILDIYLNHARYYFGLGNYCNTAYERSDILEIIYHKRSVSSLILLRNHTWLRWHIFEVFNRYELYLLSISNPEFYYLFCTFKFVEFLGFFLVWSIFLKVFVSVKQVNDSYNAEYSWRCFRENKNNLNLDWLRDDLSLEVLDKYAKNFMEETITYPDALVMDNDNKPINKKINKLEATVDNSFAVLYEYTSFVERKKNELFSNLVLYEDTGFIVKKRKKKENLSIKKMVKVYKSFFKDLIKKEEQLYGGNKFVKYLTNFESSLNFDYKSFFSDSSLESFQSVLSLESARLDVFLAYGFRRNSDLKILYNQYNLTNKIYVSFDKQAKSLKEMSFFIKTFNFFFIIEKYWLNLKGFTFLWHKDISTNFIAKTTKSRLGQDLAIMDAEEHINICDFSFIIFFLLPFYFCWVYLRMGGIEEIFSGQDQAWIVFFRLIFSRIHFLYPVFDSLLLHLVQDQANKFSYNFKLDFIDTLSYMPANRYAPGKFDILYKYYYIYKNHGDVGYGIHQNSPVSLWDDYDFILYYGDFNTIVIEWITYILFITTGHITLLYYNSKFFHRMARGKVLLINFNYFFDIYNFYNVIKIKYISYKKKLKF